MGKSALCVGINHFKHYPGSALQGCVNDARDMAGVLKDLLGFKSRDITLLTDAQATKAAILKHLKAMVDRARAGQAGHLVFSLSSHGTQVPDKNGDEPDKADEAFCPHDLAQAGDEWDPGHIITDDELHDLFSALPEEVVLEVFLDTCHSGTGLKAVDLLLDRKPRYLPPPSFAAFAGLEGRQAGGLYRGFLDRGVTRHILWAACRSDQTSADAHIANGWHGAFTYFFCRELRTSKNQISRAELLAKVRAGLKTAHYAQVPQLECASAAKKQPVA